MTKKPSTLKTGILAFLAPVSYYLYILKILYKEYINSCQFCHFATKQYFFTLWV